MEKEIKIYLVECGAKLICDAKSDAEVGVLVSQRFSFNKEDFS